MNWLVTFQPFGPTVKTLNAAVLTHNEITYLCVPQLNNIHYSSTIFSYIQVHYLLKPGTKKAGAAVHVGVHLVRK